MAKKEFIQTTYKVRVIVFAVDFADKTAMENVFFETEKMDINLWFGQGLAH